MRLALVFLSFVSIVTAQEYEQIGNDLIGLEEEASFGRAIDLNENGTRMVVMSNLYDSSGNPPAIGAVVRMYGLESGDWVQLGGDLITDRTANLVTNTLLSINDTGDIIAIGLPDTDDNGLTEGKVQVYQFLNGDWIQLGQDLFGDEINDQFGFAVALNDEGSRIAIGAKNGLADGERKGYVKVYDYVNGVWEQNGVTIFGEAFFDNLGWAVSLNGSGNVMAISQPFKTDNGIGTGGQVRIYEYESGLWNQLGTDVRSSVNDEAFGKSLKLTEDGFRIVIAAPENSEFFTNGGVVRVYDYDGVDWVQVGSSIYGQGFLSLMGQSLDISGDGTRTIVGEPLLNVASENLGSASVFELISNDWVQIGNTLSENQNQSQFGSAVSMSNNGAVVAVGGHGFDLDHPVNTAEGLVRVYGEIILGLDDSDLSAITISPNPIYDAVFISNPNEYSISNVQIYDLLGNVVFSEEELNNQIFSTYVNVSGLSTGTYVLVFEVENREIRIKLIKE